MIAWLLSELLIPLGVVEPLTLQELVFRMTPGCSSPSDRLTAKLCGLISLKGEDIMLQSQTEVPIKYHRLRTSLPARLWRWKVVSGWKWKGDVEHINVLEARAAMTSIRWRVLQKKQTNIRCIHLVDSLVVLHALTRGRSSSRKLRRTMMRISAYLLASGLQPLWAYVDTKQNPADKPSRWGVRKKWLKK